MADSNHTPSRPSKRAGASSTPSRPGPPKRSSSRKVARAARARRSFRDRPKLGFPALIFAICVAGTLLVAYARGERSEAVANAEPPRPSDHWHAAYGIYVCDHFLVPFPQEPPGQDKTGIHTHGDGIIHIHPFGSGAAGFNARLGVWAETIGMKLGNDWFTGSDGVEYRNGYDCNGEPANVYVYRWASAFDPQQSAEVFTSGFPEIRLRTDRSAFTFAVVPESKVNDVPKPDSVPTLNSLSDVDPSQQGGSAPSIPTDLSIPGPSSDPTASSLPVDPPVPGDSPPVSPPDSPPAPDSPSASPSGETPAPAPDSPSASPSGETPAPAPAP